MMAGHPPGDDDLLLNLQGTYGGKLKKKDSILVEEGFFSLLLRVVSPCHVPAGARISLPVVVERSRLCSQIKLRSYCCCVRIDTYRWLSSSSSYFY